LVLVSISLFKVYKEKNFARLSGFAPMLIGIGAFLGFFQLIKLMWSHDATFSSAGAIFQFINYFLVIAVYFGGSMQISRIRKTFLLSERVAKIKASPEFQQAMQNAQNAQAPMGNPYGPMGMGVPPTPAPTNTTTTSTPGQAPTQPNAPKVSKERVELEKMKVVDLKKVAKKLSISGYSSMKKPELIKNILRVTNTK